MSSHFKFSLAMISVAAFGLLGMFAALHVALLRVEDKYHIGKSSTVLRRNDREAVQVLPDSNEVVIQTPTGKKVEYVRNPTVHIQKDGTIRVDRHLIGLEHAPVFGVGYDGNGRLYGGVAVAYAWRLDANLLLSAVPDKTAPGSVEAVAAGSYNFWRHTSLFVGINPVNLILREPPNLHAGLTFRF